MALTIASDIYTDAVELFLGRSDGVSTHAPQCCHRFSRFFPLLQDDMMGSDEDDESEDDEDEDEDEIDLEKPRKKKTKV